MNHKAVIAVTALVALLPLAANAGEVENRIQDQQARINQGVRSGNLTYGEDRRLQGAENRIQAERNRDLARNDGHLTGHEAASLNRQENRLSTRIYADKHNGRRY
jgi:hypothetical protein